MSAGQVAKTTPIMAALGAAATVDIGDIGYIVFWVYASVVSSGYRISWDHCLLADMIYCLCDIYYVVVNWSFVCIAIICRVPVCMYVVCPHSLGGR